LASGFELWVWSVGFGLGGLECGILGLGFREGRPAGDVSRVWLFRVRVFILNTISGWDGAFLGPGEHARPISLFGFTNWVSAGSFPLQN